MAPDSSKGSGFLGLGKSGTNLCLSVPNPTHSQHKKSTEESLLANRGGTFQPEFVGEHHGPALRDPSG